LTAACIAVAAAIPAAPAYADSIRDKQWHLTYLKIAEAQQISEGEGITVAVIDSGVAGHQDLTGNVLNGIDVVAGGSGNGRGDTEGHGTAMAGLIAAHGHGSGDGALGIAPKAKILPVRSSTAKLQGVDKPLAEGIRWAIAHGAKIINISQNNGDVESGRAVNEAQAAGVLVFAAAGNTDKDTGVAAPARWPWAVAVGGVDKAGRHSATSVTGPEVELSAPSVDVVSTSTNNVWQKGTGTSDAAAIVSGVAAMVWSRYPQLSAREVLHRLEATAVDKGPAGRDPEYGFGVIDPIAALTADVPPLASPTPAAGGPLPTLGSKPAVAAAAQKSGISTAILAGVSIGFIVLMAVVTTIVLVVVRSRRRRVSPSLDPPGGAAGWPGGGRP
jgi:type VII secretion-associated serine protease mycosin